MNDKDDEIRRLQRLREEQLQARDPKAKEQAQSQRIAARHHARQHKRITLKSIIMDFPMKWLLMIVGGLLGILVAVIINMVIPNDPVIQIVGYVAIVFGIVAGRVMGAIRDWGDEDWISKY